LQPQGVTDAGLYHLKSFLENFQLTILLGLMLVSDRTSAGAKGRPSGKERHGFRGLTQYRMRTHPSDRCGLAEEGSETRASTNAA
jgi:hypothetical protein